MTDNLDELHHTEGSPLGEDVDLLLLDRRLKLVPKLDLIGLGVAQIVGG